MESIIKLEGHLMANPPSDKIYDFKGYFWLGNQYDCDAKEPLSLENSMWADTVLAS
jgi:hypothetical protein